LSADSDIRCAYSRTGDVRLRAARRRATMSCFRSQEHSIVTAFHNLEMKSITGEKVKFDAYKGKVCLIVNLASR
jgi:hypothetical protein